MDKNKKKILIGITLIQLLLYSNVFSVYGELPVIASRISEIIEVTVLTDSAYNTPNNTVFGIDTKVEILNRDTKNQTVVEDAICYPKVNFNATLVNQSLEIERISAGCLDIFAMYYYQPNITIEYDIMKLYVNQTGLNHLPDGNYTLWRYIEYGSTVVDGTPGEILLTLINMNSGIMNVTYSYFDNPHTNEVSLTVMFPIAFLAIFSQIAAIYKKRKHK
ncbi:MAG: hypothetical protein KAU62_08645 [Candidatus Heimdallarchaeota archaeon]|nr:hypothetical protein [Candidatus Heimdallarchaeota archaeon]MCG3256136.1 hypothetical protein [Candidatus Heimdallarchaeota archaeon]MCK4611207.1 hypothetical protein [Candidatus Heimdallarchaeota archaeon]